MSTPKLSKYGWIQISLQKPLKLAGFTSNLITFFGFTYFSVGYAVCSTVLNSCNLHILGSSVQTSYMDAPSRQISNIFIRAAKDSRPHWLIDSKILVNLKILIVILYVVIIGLPLNDPKIDLNRLCRQKFGRDHDL